MTKLERGREEGVEVLACHRSFGRPVAAAPEWSPRRRLLRRWRNGAARNGENRRRDLLLGSRLDSRLGPTVIRTENI
jgi:hypothetical protein